MKIYLAIFVATIALTGCNKSPSVDASSGKGSTFRIDENENRSSTQSTSVGASGNQKQQMLSALIDASGLMDSYISSVYFSSQSSKKYLTRIEQTGIKWARGPDKRFDGHGPSLSSDLLMTDKELVNLSGLLNTSTPVDEWLLPIHENTMKFKAGDVEAGKLFTLQISALKRFIDGNSACTGWATEWRPVKGLTEEEADTRLINERVRGIKFSNTLSAALAKNMPRAYLDKAEFKKHFARALSALSRYDIELIFEQATREAEVELSRSPVVQDLAGGKSCAWNTDSGTKWYELEQSGLVFKNGGNVIYGQGYINNNFAELDSSSSVNSDLKTEFSSSKATGQSTDKSTKASVAIQ